MNVFWPGALALAVYTFSANWLGFVALDLFGSTRQATSLAPSVLRTLAVTSQQPSKAVFARVVVIELSAQSGADARDDVPAGLEVSLIVLVAAAERVEVLASLGIVECELELSSVTLVVSGQ